MVIFGGVQVFDLDGLLDAIQESDADLPGLANDPVDHTDVCRPSLCWTFTVLALDLVLELNQLRLEGYQWNLGMKEI